MPNKFNELLLKQDIIELYNTGITPDYGYLMNGRFEKDMVKTLYHLKTLSGNPISWEASDTEYLFPVVSLEPKQAGSGDPSPENVRPISGYDSVSVGIAGKNLLNYTGEVVIPQNLYALPITDSELGSAIKQLPRGIQLVMSANWSYYTEISAFKTIMLYEEGITNPIRFEDGSPQTIPKNYNVDSIFMYGGQNKTQDSIVSNIQFEAGSTPTAYEPYQGTTATITLPETIYGGTVDAVSGVGSNETIMFEMAIADMNNDENFPGWRAVPYLTDIVVPGYNGGINDEILKTCNIVKSAFNDTNISYIAINTLGTNSVLYLTKTAFGLTQTQWKEQYPDLVVQICLKRISPEPFQATGNQQLTSLLGYNTIYTNGESIKLNRKARRLEV